MRFYRNIERILKRKGIVLREGVNGRACAQSIGRNIFLFRGGRLVLIKMKWLTSKEHNSSEIFEHWLQFIVIGNDKSEVTATGGVSLFFPDSSGEAVEYRPN